MPSDPRFDGLNARIKKLEAVAASPSTAKPDGLLKRYAPYLGLAIALIVLFFGNGLVSNYFTLTMNSLIDKKLEPINGKIGNISTQLSEIQGELKRMVAVQKIDDAARESVPQLAKSLSDVREAILSARQIGAKPPDQVLSMLQSSLLNLTYAHDQRPERLLGWDKAVGD